MTDSRIEDTRNYYKNDIERREKNIAGLKAIGKNYNYKKDGGQFTDVRKTLDGDDFCWSTEWHPTTQTGNSFMYEIVTKLFDELMKHKNN